MALKNEFFYKSRDEKNMIHAVEWSPEDGKVIAVLQIVHGMAEHIERYEDFANFMVGKGFVVVGEDHLGHGKSVKSESDFGYFAENDGAGILVRDVHRLKKLTEEKYPGIPYFILGHSMGSYITRRYITWYGKGITGCILVGTGFQKNWQMNVGLTANRIFKVIFGDRHRSGFITRLMFGQYLSHIDNPRTENDWLCSDEKIVDAFKNDPACDFIFTGNGYRALFTLIKDDCNIKNVNQIPKNLPVYITAGAEDPVGQFGKGVMQTYELFQTAGINDLKVKIYPKMRHEIINEIGKEVVYKDILEWLQGHM